MSNLAVLPTRPALVLVRGLPGSGKSTYARNEAIGALHVEADMYFETNGVYKFDPMKIKEAHAWCQKQTKAALLAGSSVYVSNTFVKKWEIDVYRKIAEEVGADVFVVTTTYPGTSTHSVPNDVLDRMSANWDADVGPAWPVGVFY